MSAAPPTSNQTRSSEPFSHAAPRRWPPQIGITWKDEGQYDERVQESQTRFPGEDG